MFITTDFAFKFAIILVFLFTINNIFCQNSTEIDSLLNITKSNNSDTIKIDAYSSLFFIYEFSDTVKAKHYLNQELKLSKQNENTKWLASTYGHFAFFCEDKSDLNEAIEYHQKSLSLYNANQTLNNELKNKYISACYNNMALIYGKLGVYNKALDYYILSLKMDEKAGDSLGISIGYSNIGTIQRKLGNLDKALEYYFKSLKIVEKLDDKNRMSACYNNIGLAYQYKKDYEKAILYISKSLKIDEKINDLNRLASCYNNLGNVYYDLKDYNKCKFYYDKALSIRYQLGDKNGQSSVLGNIASLNNKLKQYDQAVTNANKSLSIAHEIGALPWQRSSYATLSETYDSIENYKKAYENYKLLKEINDSIFSIENNRQIKGMEAKYENEKKQKEIELLNKDKQLQNIEIRQQNIVKYAFIIGFLFMVLLVIFVYRNYRNKRKANLLLSKQNFEINQQKEEITAQRDEIEAQRDMVMIQKNHIEEQKQEITDSINYAKRIQQAILPDFIQLFGNSIQSSVNSNQTVQDSNVINKQNTNNKTPNTDYRLPVTEYFILFKPKDIVSGDFYWTTRVNEWLIVTVADCTGHGVPGAFMSMLGVSFLNEIVRKKEVTKASDVLDHLRTSIIEALSQAGDASTSSATSGMKDGMDIVLCAINTTNNTLQFAGANNSLYIVSSSNLEGFSEQSAKANNEQQTFRQAQCTATNNKLFELKPDKQPVAIYEHMTPFTNHIIQLNSGDTLYLMSDGYQDQFGGLKGKKFLSKNLKQLLLDNCQLPMPEQKQILEKTLVEWIGEGEQIDDITILGIRI